MAEKNPDLCQRPFCRKRYEWLVEGKPANERPWHIRLCQEHASPYLEEREKGKLLYDVSIVRREDHEIAQEGVE